MAFSGKDALRSAISSQGIDALYSCVGLESNLGSVRELGPPAARADHRDP